MTHGTSARVGLSSTSATRSLGLAPTAFFGGISRSEPAPSWLIEEISARWPVEGSVAMTLISVSENATFRVLQDGGPVAVLRVSRPGYLEGATAVRSELEWIEAIGRDTGLRVPSAIRAKDGQLLATLRSPEDGPLVAVMFPFVKGDILEDVADPLPWFDTIGEATAVLHEHSIAWSAPAGFARFRWDLTDMVGSDCRWGRWESAEMSAPERRLLSRAQDKALAGLVDTPQTRRNSGLIHADIRPSNVMISDETLTIIDFDDSGYSWYLYDLAAAMTWLDHTDDAPALAQAWVSGYRRIRDFTGADALLATRLDLIRSLTMLGWCTTHRYEAIPAAVRDIVVDAAAVVAQRYLASETWLLDG